MTQQTYNNRINICTNTETVIDAPSEHENSSIDGDKSVLDSNYPISEMSDHPDIEFDDKVYPIPVAPQVEQGLPAGEADRHRLMVEPELVTSM